MAKKTTILFFLIITALTTFAQQQGAITQFMFNGLALNPAYAGSHEALSVTFLNRYQWVGLKGAPTTQTLAIHSPLKVNHLAVGGLIVRDKIGVSTQTGVYTSGAYKIDHHNYHISLGMQAGIIDRNNDFSSLRLGADDDPNFSKMAQNQLLPSAGVGAYYYRSNMYIGLSVPELLKSKDDNTGEWGRTRHYYLTGGFVYPLNQNIKIKPNALFKYSDNAPLSVDLNVSALFNDVIWAGVSWRSFDSIDLILELQVTHNFRLGYAFDVTTSDLAQTNYGTHELVLNYRYSKNIKKMVVPRFF